MLYFAYGSNLHHFQMRRRCKDSIFLKKINLNGFKLTFNAQNISKCSLSNQKYIMKNNKVIKLK